MSNVNNVTGASADPSGGLRVAAYGSTLPTDASTALDAAFATLGYISEDGLTVNKNISTTSEKSWSKDTIFSGETGVEETYKVKLCEELNPEVQKVVFEDSNVAVNDDGTLKSVYSNSVEHAAKSWIIEMNLKGGAIKRIVIPNGTVTAISEIPHKPGEPIKYEITITAMPDANLTNADGVASASVTYYA